MNDGVIRIVFSLVYVSLKEFGVVGSDTYTWGIKDFHKCWSGSLAKRRLCLGPAGVINCTPVSALSFRVSLFPGTRGYNSVTVCFWVWACMHLICSHRALSLTSPAFCVCLNVAGTSPTATLITKEHAFSDGSVIPTGP